MNAETISTTIAGRPAKVTLRPAEGDPARLRDMARQALRDVALSPWIVQAALDKMEVHDER